MTSGFLSKLLDFIAPRACVCCGCRLSADEEALCAVCNMHLPRTGYEKTPADNPLNRLFWGKLPIERASALFFYHAHSSSGNILYALKYRGHAEVGEMMGRMIAKEWQAEDFFDGIDMIVPVPLARSRERKRGYNQSREIARGISCVTGIPVNVDAVVRTSFKVSQTHLSLWERMENVDDVFSLKSVDGLAGKHILLIDDVITTGATITACAMAMKVADNVRFSVLSIGFAYSAV